MSDHGWDVLLQIVTAIIAGITAVLARGSAKHAKQASDKTDDLMKQCMRSILMRVFTGQVTMPDETVNEMFNAYTNAGGNHEVADYAIKYFKEINDEPKKEEEPADSLSQFN